MSASSGSPGEIAAYGPGYREIFAPVAMLAPASPDWAIFAANALLSALVPPLAFAIGRMTGLASGPAFVAALLLAIDPIAIRTGATEAYFAAIVVFCTAASAIHWKRSIAVVWLPSSGAINPGWTAAFRMLAITSRPKRGLGTASARACRTKHQ